MRRTLKVWCLVLLSVFFSASLIAQPREESNTPPEKFRLKDRLFVGGGLGLSFGDITFINISPEVGVRITDRFAAGIGGIYQYYKDSRFTPDFETSVYGGNVFARYSVFQDIFLTTDFRLLNLEGLQFAGQDTRVERVNVPIWFVGAGYRVSVGSSGSAFLITVMYDVIQDINSPYGDRPFINLGVAIGL